MAVDQEQLQQIVAAVVAKLQTEEKTLKTTLGIFENMNDAIAAAKEAQKVMQKMPMDFREKIIINIRKKSHEHAEILAKLAVEETGMGNVGDKILNCLLYTSPSPRD